MTTTLRRPAVNGAHARPFATGDLAPKGRLNRARIAVGVLVIAVSVVGVVALVGRNAERVSVLVLTADVPAGSAIGSEHLTSIELPAGASLDSVPVEAADQVVGRVAAVTLLQGTLLAPNHVSAEQRVPAGMSLVGAVLNPGQYPVDLGAGDQVRLIETSADITLQADSGTADLGTAEVRGVAEPTTGAASLTVSLLVSQDQAEAAAAAGSQGRLNLVVVGSR